MKKVGLLCGREYSFPPAFIARVNQMGAKEGVAAEFVKLGGTRGDQIAVLSGIQAGEEIVTSGVFKLRNGAAVQVNNKVQPGNKAAPKPEDS